MDMKIDGASIKRARERRAWSQQHLASAAGLSLRTVQRIESSGNASYDSVQAIASCLELSIAALAADDRPRMSAQRYSLRNRIAGSVLAAIGVASVALLSIQGALAEQILLDLGAVKTQDADTHELATQVVLDDGKPYELVMDGAFKFEITATETERDQILISIRLYNFKDDDFVLVAEPKVLTEYGKPARIELGTNIETAPSFSMRITPTAN